MVLAHPDAVLDQAGLVAVQLVVEGLVLLLSLKLFLGQFRAADGDT